MARRGMGGRSGGRRRASSRRRRTTVRKRSRHLDGVTRIDINDVDFVSKFVTEHGKIVPARLTGATARQQRRLKRGVRRARQVGLAM